MSKFRFETSIFIITASFLALLTMSCASTKPEETRGVCVELMIRPNTIICEVRDLATGKPVIYCPVNVMGTTFGAVTNINGVCTIYNVPSGTWEVIAKNMGYKARIDTVITGENPAFADFQLEED